MKTIIKAVMRCLRRSAERRVECVGGPEIEPTLTPEEMAEWSRRVRDWANSVREHPAPTGTANEAAASRNAAPEAKGK